MPTKIINDGMDPEMMKAVEAAGKILTAFFRAVTETGKMDNATAKMIAKSEDGFFEISIRQMTKSEVVGTITGAGIDKKDRDVLFENLDWLKGENSNKKESVDDVSERFS